MDAAEFPLFVQIQLFMLNNAHLRYTRKNIFKGKSIRYAIKHLCTPNTPNKWNVTNFNASVQSCIYEFKAIL